MQIAYKSYIKNPRGKIDFEKSKKSCSKYELKNLNEFFPQNPIDLLGSNSVKNLVCGEVEIEDGFQYGDDVIVSSKSKFISELSLKEIIMIIKSFIESKSEIDCKGISKQFSRTENNKKFGSATNLGKYSSAITKRENSITANSGNHSLANACKHSSIAATTNEYSLAITEDYASFAISTGDKSISAANNEKSISCVLGGDSISHVRDRDSVSICGGEDGLACAENDMSLAIAYAPKSAAVVNGPNSVAYAVGYKSIAKGALGTYLLFNEWKKGSVWYDELFGRHMDLKLIGVKSFLVNGTTVKANTYYILNNGKLQRASEKHIQNGYETRNL